MVKLNLVKIWVLNQARSKIAISLMKLFFFQMLQQKTLILNSII